MAGVGSQDIERRFALSRLSGDIPILVFYDFRYFFVKRSERDLSRANFCTKIAVNASARHVDGSGQMKHRVFGRQIAGPNQRVLFEGADIAEADRAYVAATVALYASVKFPLPVIETAEQIQGHDFVQAVIRYRLGFFARDELVRERLTALVGLCQLRRTGYANSYYPIRLS
jgi:hypothetical protein